MPRRKPLTPWEKEWNRLIVCEERFLDRKPPNTANMLNQKLEKHIPEKLQSTLDAAYYKAFQLIYTKGTGIIEKTYDKEKRSVEYKIKSYAAELKGSRRSLSAFRKKSEALKAANLAVSAVEGIGLGVLGIGLPDIPLFTGMILKSIYEIAVNYGFPYETEEEQIFLLQVIETAVSKGDLQRKKDAELNRWCQVNEPSAIDRQSQIKNTAKALSGELLYMKFLQGIPVAGAIGGLSDVQCLKTITDYANLKYQRRFLLKKKRDGENNR